MSKSKHVAGERRDRLMTGALVKAVTLAVLIASSGPMIALAQDPTPTLSAPAGMAPRTLVAPDVVAPTQEADPAPAGSLSAPGNAPVTPPVVAVPAPAHDLSPMGMFHAADPVVKGVMVLLVVASIATWTVLFVRGLGLFISKFRLKRSLRKIREAGGLAEASAKVTKGVGGRLLQEAAEEARLSQGLPNEGVKERVHIALSRLETEIGRRMAFGTGLLATVGSVGPFVGLFGTVWGIMRSFIGIANSNTTNLAVVAPGIAEALLATGIGLVAAIPAVVIYNTLVRAVASYRVLMGDAVALILRHLSRDLDRHGSGSTVRENDSMHLAAE